jgi:TonB family protein
MRSVSITIAAVLLTLSADAATQRSPPLQCLDERGRPFLDAFRPVRISGSLTRPRLVHRDWPAWPEGPQSIQGVILIESIIDRHGRVCAARLRKGSGPLAKSALAAMKQWKFEPARINGRPVAVYYTLEMRFCP